VSKQTKLTKFARGKTCTLEIHPYCLHEQTDTVILAHISSPKKGWAIKSPDWFGVHACVTCHDIIDGRMQVKDVPHAEIQACIMRGLYKTLKRVIDEGGLI
jgi:hypothetical protein